MVLVHLRKGETFAELGAGAEVSTSTAWRYVQEHWRSYTEVTVFGLAGLALVQ
ncbi:hypothetical protein BJY14_007839 [Actinomadura luteofluorescens]|uniref:Transposase Helix-turn-helix domain-containing protein n=1 Tax=Actinomadura luteofluorescens TaxID=46163 RepID=A0A7Y9EQE4_9ACTN|nr:hypothetical protein [Actinomadura luteofluorescens]